MSNNTFCLAKLAMDVWYYKGGGSVVIFYLQINEFFEVNLPYVQSRDVGAVNQFARKLNLGFFYVQSGSDDNLVH